MFQSLVSVSIPKRASEAVNQSHECAAFQSDRVSIPKRASEAVNLTVERFFANNPDVSIPKRASEAVNQKSDRDKLALIRGFNP